MADEANGRTSRPGPTTVRQATMELFRFHGLTTWFGNPGSSELTLLQEFPADFRYFLGLQEMIPVGMADGGIDVISGDSIVYQVKWSSKLQQNPDTWLDGAIAAERPASPAYARMHAPIWPFPTVPARSAVRDGCPVRA